MHGPVSQSGGGRFSAWRASLAGLMAYFGSGGAHAATPSQPTTVTLFSDAASNSQLILSITQSSGSCPGAGQSGTGQISSLVLFGHDLTAVAGAAPDVPFQNLCIDAAGNIVGGSLKLTADFSTPLIFGGLGLTLGQGTTLTVVSQTDTVCKSAPCLKFSGTNIALALPLHDSAGTAAQVVLPDGSLAVAVGSGFTLKATGLQLRNALAGGTVGFGGFAFTINGGIDLDIARANGVTQTMTVTVHQPQVSVPLPIPGLLAQDEHGITLKADSVAVNKNGQIEIAHGTAQNVNLPLAAPLDFILQAATVNFDKRFDDQDTVVTKNDCVLTGAKLTLPALVSDSNNNRVVLNVVGAEPGGGWDVGKTPVVAIDTPDIRLSWSGFGVQIPQGTKNLILDLSNSARDAAEGSGLDASWQGIYVAKANLLLPKTFSDGGNDVSIQTTGLAIGNQGLSLTVDASFPGGRTVQVAGGFAATLHDVSFKVENNHLDAQDMKIDADVNLPILGASQWAMQFTDSGNFVLTLQNGSLDGALGGKALFSGADLGGVHFDLTNATLLLPAAAGQLGSLDISGAMTLRKAAGSSSDLAAALDGLVMSFTDLGIDTQGHFKLPSTGQFTLSHPVSVDLKVLQLDLTNFTAGNDGDASPYLLLNGGVSVGEGLPASAEVDFAGLKIGAAGAVSMNGLEIKADVADMLRLDAKLQHIDKANAVWPAAGANSPPVGCFQSSHNGAHVPISCLQGALMLSVNLGGLSMGTGADGFTFEAAQGAWLFTGGMGLPVGGIPLGQSNSSLFKFRGGVGYKAQAADQVDQPSASAHIGDSAYVVYLDPTLPGDDLLFTIGTTIGSAADSGFTFTADADAIVTTDPFTIDLSARAMFQEPSGTSFENADRTAYMDIRYLAPDTLHATAGADLYYPTRSIDLVDAHGSMDLLLSPNEAHFFLGWPPATDPIAVNIGLNGVEKFTFTGGLGVHLLGSGNPAIDADPYSGNTGPWFAAALTWHGELGPLSADIAGSADISLQNGGQIVSIVGTVSASGQADFGPFSASAAGDLTLAYLTKGNSVNLPTADGTSLLITANSGDEIYVDGEVRGCGSVFGFSKCLNLDVSDTL